MGNQETAMSHRVPATLDSPTPILFWEPMEFIMSVSALGLGVIMHAMFMGIFMAGLVLWLSKKLKRGAKRGAVPHYMWYSGLELDPALKRWFPPAWKNDFME